VTTEHKCALSSEYLTIDYIHSDHSPDNIKFPDNSMMVRDTPAHVKCYSYHAVTSVIVSHGGRNATVCDQEPK